MASLSNIFAVLHHWIPRNTTRHTIAMAEKVKYNESKSKICIFNDCDNSGGESETNKQQVNFLNHYVHFEFMKHTSMYEQRCSQTRAYLGIYQGIDFFCPTINIIFFRKTRMVHGVLNQFTSLSRPRWNLGWSTYIAKWILTHVTTVKNRLCESVELMVPYRRSLRALCTHGTYKTMPVCLKIGCVCYQ